MIDKETLFKAIDSIDEDLVDEAAEYRFADRSFIPRLLAAAAAVLIFGGAAFAASKLISLPAPGQEAAVTEAAPTERPLLYKSADISARHSSDEAIPRSGETIYDSALLSYAHNEAYKDYLFPVSIGFYSFRDIETFLKESNDEYLAELQEIDSMPIMDKYREAFLEWYASDENYDPMESDGAEKSPNKEDWLKDGYALALFDSYWLENASREDILEYRAALEMTEKAAEDYDSKTDEESVIKPWRDAEIQKEMERLGSLGVRFESITVGDGRSMTVALLSQEQIIHFPASDDWGYILHWIGGDGALDT